MMRFWHKLRFRLIGDQNAKRYILYATGEIFLIVVGILIAFQVNNWDIRKKQEIQAIELVRNLRNDLMRDTANFQVVVQEYSDKYKKQLRVLETEDFRDLSGDSILDMVIPIYRTMDFVSPSFRKMESVGLTELAGFGDLFDRVNSYYTTIQNNYRNFIDWDKNTSLKEAEFWYYNPDFENYYHEIFIGDSLPSVQSESERKQVLVQLLKTPKVRNLLRSSAFRKQLTIQRISETRQFAVDLLVVIDSTLGLR